MCRLKEKKFFKKKRLKTTWPHAEERVTKVGRVEPFWLRRWLPLSAPVRASTFCSGELASAHYPVTVIPGARGFCHHPHSGDQCLETFGCHRWGSGVVWHLVGRGQGCH